MVAFSLALSMVFDKAFYDALICKLLKPDTCETLTG